MVIAAEDASKVLKDSLNKGTCPVASKAVSSLSMLIGAIEVHQRSGAQLSQKQEEFVKQLRSGGFTALEAAFEKKCVKP